MIIVFDTETTGLLAPSEADIKRQPYITEIAMIKLNDDLTPAGEITTLIKPAVPIDESSKASQITGITNASVANAPSFAEALDEISRFVLGSHTLVAHNLAFDRSMLGNELIRINRLACFPWPMKHVCTVEITTQIENRRLKLSDLYYKATGKQIEGAHRAINDVRALVDCYKWCVLRGFVK
jgi:DNA polymerase-3 subunit epsilon